eukprot:TRINITY_DN8312_c0_g1_i1.p1 TRINITY_DN8312_c0_g1~~TRINITY_DN8312_c0_g1_i1.p1  ORF type:complete len:379 (+),score=110.08 TRINITY_DN8312_c0_g1_i1:195-1331(+)
MDGPSATAVGLRILYEHLFEVLGFEIMIICITIFATWRVVDSDVAQELYDDEGLGPILPVTSGGDAPSQPDDSLVMALVPAPVDDQTGCCVALTMPVTCSIGLLTMYFFPNAFAIFLVIYLLVIGTFGIVLGAKPAVNMLVRQLSDTALSVRLPCCSWVTAVDFACFLAALSIVFFGVATGNHVLHNVTATGVIITGLKFFRMPSVRVASLLLLGVFFYDIFWVFFSEGIFGKNVMEEAVMQPATNPIHAASEALHVESSWISERLSPPVAITSDFFILGLGDILLPGTLIVLSLRYDLQRCGTWRGGFWIASLLGYVVGSLVSTASVFVFMRGQPALLYLVPSTLGATLALAWYRGELRSFWSSNSPNVLRHPRTTA